MTGDNAETSRDMYRELGVSVQPARPSPNPKPDPGTTYTATIETVDNDRASSLVEWLVSQGRQGVEL